MGAEGGIRTDEAEIDDPRENAPYRVCENESESPRDPGFRDHSRPVSTADGAGPSDAELERAIVSAITMGLSDVAQTLAKSLEERRRTPNVIDLEQARRTRR